MLLHDILEIRVLNVPKHTKKLKSAGKIIKPTKMNSWAKQISSLLILLVWVMFVCYRDRPFTFSARDYLIDSAEAAVSLFHGVSLV